MHRYSKVSGRTPRFGALKRSAQELCPQQVTYLMDMDMTKAEALDDLGDGEAGIKLAEKYL